MLYLETILSKVCNALIQSPKINLFELPNEEKQAHIKHEAKNARIKFCAIGTFVAIGTKLPLDLSCHWNFCCHWNLVAIRTIFRKCGDNKNILTKART